MKKLHDDEEEMTPLTTRENLGIALMIIGALAIPFIVVGLYKFFVL